ncbi:MAG: BrnT family toxin [Pirellulales bacterium]|nr:BrnT family toxin [Pirellulales bacterium]
MKPLQFTWDEKKNRANRRKHGVSFEEAQTAFFDQRAKVYFDPDHSDDEDRFILLGVSYRLRELVVCHCYREKDALIRIISARKADKREREDYRSKTK